MMSLTQQRRYRRSLAWIGFFTLYLALPIALIVGVHYVSTLGVTHYDRDQFLAEAHARP